MKTSKIEVWRGQVRMPLPLAEWLKGRADSNFRSLNAELVEIARRAKEQEAHQRQGASK